MTTQTVTIRYKVDASGAIQATGAVVKTVTNLGTAANSTNKALAAQARQINSIQGALREYTQNLRSLFGLYLTFQGVQTFSRFVDEYTNLNGRLKVVIDNTQKYAIAQTQVYQIAQATYSSLSATANLYARLTVSLEELNSSQNEIAQITRTVNQALLVSGATSAEASSAIIQLSQSFASGVLRGEEFNAVNEAAPRIMTSLAKSLGVSRGALREMASEGKLTAEVLRKALVDDALNIAKEAENVPLTIGRGYERLRNDLLQYVGAADQVYGVSRKVAESLVWLGQNLEQVAGYASQAFQAVVIFSGAKGLAGLVGAATRAYQAGTLLSTAFLAIGGWPVLIGAAVTALVLFRNELFTVSEVAKEASTSLDRLQILLKIDPAAAGKLAVDTYRMLQTEIAKVTQEIEKQQALMNANTFGGASQADFDKLDNLKAQLAALQVELSKSDAAFDSFDNHAQRVSRAAGTGTDAVAKYANAQRTFNETLTASGTPLGRQIKAAEELKAGLLALDQQSKKGIGTTKMEGQQRTQLLATYQKELSTIGKSTEIKKKSATSDLARASATERLNNIISQYTREQDDANKVLKQLEGIQSEVNNLVRRYPELANAGAEATRLIGLAAADAGDKFRGFKDAVRGLLEQFGQGNINQTSQQLLQLGIALDEAFAAGDSEAVARIIRAMEAIEQQAGLSATASEELGAANRKLADEAKQQAEDYQRYWEGAFGAVSDAIGDFVASGMRDWKAFGKDLLRIVQKIVSDIVSEFLRLKLINPVLNQVLGSALPTGTSGGGLLGSLMGGGGGVGGSFGGAGWMASAIPVIGAIIAGMMANNNLYDAGWRPGEGDKPAGAAYYGLSVLTPTAILSGVADRLLQGLGLSGRTASMLSGSAVVQRLFGRSAPELTGSTTTATFGANGVGLTQTLRTLERGGVFRSDRRRTRPGEVTDDATRAAESLFDAVEMTMTNAARSLQSTAPAMLDAALRTVQEYDSKGKIKSTKYFLDILGRTFEEATAEAAVSRLNSESLIATIDAALGPASLEASTIAERWRSDASVLAEGAQFLLLAATDIRAGTGLLGDGGTLSDVTSFVEGLQHSGETLSAAYQRISASASLMDEAFSRLGAEFAGTREQAVAFAVGIVEAAGGLERAASLWASYFQIFYSEEERQAFAIQEARTRATDALSGVGLNLGDFEGTGGLARFRQLFEEQLSTLSAEAVVQWLEAANALGAFVEATGTLNEVIDDTLESVTSLADLMSTVDEELLAFNSQSLSFSERMANINRDIELLIKHAVLLGATEEDIARIRELGQHRLNAVLAEQNEAISAYTNFIAGFAANPTEGMSEFNTELYNIAQSASAAAAEANRLALAAGMAGASAEDLATIQIHAAELAARAAAKLEQSIVTLRDQLGYLDDAAAAATSLAGLIYGRFELPGDAIVERDPERFSLAVSLGAQIRELAEFTGETVTDLMGRLRVPFDRLMADFGVSIRNIGDPEIFDNLATASRTIGIELSDAASQLGANIGALSDASSLLNDGFERAVSRLPTAVSNQLTNLLRNLETSVGPEAQEAARRQLSDFINAQPPAIRDALAPFLDDVDTSSAVSQQLAAAEQSNRYLSAANGYLERIAANTGRTPIAGGPNPKPGEKLASSDATTHQLLRDMIEAVRGLTKEQRATNVKATVGMNHG